MPVKFEEYLIRNKWNIVLEWILSFLRANRPLKADINDES